MSAIGRVMIAAYVLASTVGFSQMDMPARDVTTRPGQTIKDVQDRIDRWQKELDELEGRGKPQKEPRNYMDRERPERDTKVEQQSERQKQEARDYAAKRQRIAEDDIRISEILASIDTTTSGRNTYKLNYDARRKHVTVTSIYPKEVIVLRGKAGTGVAGFDSQVDRQLNGGNDLFSRPRDGNGVNRQIESMVQENARAILNELFPVEEGRALESLAKLDTMEKTWGQVVDKVGRDGPFGLYLNAIRQDMDTYKRQISEGHLGQAEIELRTITEQYDRMGYELLSAKIQRTLADPKIGQFDYLPDRWNTLKALGQARASLNVAVPDFFKAAGHIADALGVLQKSAGLEVPMVAPDDLLFMGLAEIRLIQSLGKQDVKILLKAGMGDLEKGAAKLAAEAGIKEATETGAKIVLGEIIEYSATHPGPLSKIMAGGGKTVAETFFESKYVQRTLLQDEVLYRYFDDEISTAFGGYCSRTKFASPKDAIGRLALDNGNKATKWVEIKIPKGSVIYEGLAAPTNPTNGYGSQVYTFIKKEWIVKHGAF